MEKDNKADCGKCIIGNYESNREPQSVLRTLFRNPLSDGYEVHLHSSDTKKADPMPMKKYNRINCTRCVNSSLGSDGDWRCDRGIELFGRTCPHYEPMACFGGVLESDPTCLPPTLNLAKPPKHYGLPDGLDVKDLIKHRGWLEGWCLGNALQYLLQAGTKGDMIEDTRKAREMLQLWEEEQK
jgi:hypothetical protein